MSTEGGEWMPRCLIEHFIVRSVSCEYLDNEEGQVRSEKQRWRYPPRYRSDHTQVWARLGQAWPGSQSFRPISRWLTTSDRDISLQSWSPEECWKVCLNNDILPSICVVNPVLSGQKPARIRGCLCFQTVTREEQTGPGLGHLYGPRWCRERQGGKVGRWGQWKEERMVTRTPRDINEHTDISIRCDLSFILISVIRLYFYNFSFSALIRF